MTAADRFFARLEPIAADDDGTLEDLAGALMAPVEIGEIARDTDTLVAWEGLFDPDTCPAALLDWLAVYNGVLFSPDVLTEADKRFAIKQAAGRYRGTPRAIVEELQRILTDTKTVYLGFFTPDEWHYSVAVLSSESPGGDLVDAAVTRQKPAGMLVDTFQISSDWTWFILAPTLIAHRETVGGEDTYVIDTPTYPTWQSVVDNFSTWQHLVDNDPDL